jgi:hypothetical protein
MITDLVRIENQTLPLDHGQFTFDEEDFLLFGMLLDPVYMAEMMWRDPRNFEYGGEYRVRDYQYIINRLNDSYAIVSCARSVGKTESEKIHAEIHPLKEYGNMLITAPELIHLLPLTDQIENNIHDNPLISELLDRRNGQTGFQHRPFQCNLIDGSKLIGRIPKRDGTGVKGMHQSQLIIEEGQDYPERGWTEINEAQPYDACVLTPFGFQKMGDLDVGCLVIGADGHATEITGTVERGEREVLRVQFVDGSVVECDAEHLWTVACGREPKRWRTIRTHEIEASLLKANRAFGSPMRPWFVPHPPVVDLAPLALPVEPYLLGLLLGDGSLRNGSATFSTADAQLVEELAFRLDPQEELVAAGGYDYRVRRREHGSRWRPVPLRAALTDLGLWGKLAHEKRVPVQYLSSSTEQRLELLRGLVDTDAHVTATGRVQFGSTSPGLADDVVALVFSLGGSLRRRAQQDLRGFRTMHSVTFRLPIETAPGHLARKAIANAVASDSMPRNIVAINRVGPKPMRCIKVMAADGLYITDGYVVTHNTVNYDSRDQHGNPDFHYWIYGVHSGNKSSGFDERVRSRVYRKIRVTALRRPDWNKERKENAIASYGGTSSPDYKRNILGEPGSGATAYFVTARVMACVDQDITRGEKQGSDYNENLYVKQTFRAEEVDEIGMSIGDLLDLPDLPVQGWWGGVDIGLTDSPTVITLWADWEYKKKMRIALMRRYTLERFRARQIREALYAITWHLGGKLMGVGVDVTGLGQPIFQEMEDDELCPPRLRDIAAGYTFNAKVEIGVAPDMVTENQGVLRDHLGNMVKEVEDEMTGETVYVVMMPFIAASTNMIRTEIDSGAYLIPFDTDVTSDMLQETKQRVERVGRRGEGGSGSTVKKGDRFHILDSIRAAFYRRRQDEIMSQLAAPPQTDVLDMADDGPTTVVEYTPYQLRELGLI